MTMTTEKLAELKRLHAAMTNCDMYGEDGAAKGVMVPQSLLDQFERALAERALEPQGQASDMEAFAKWKAYPLPPLNADGQFVPDSLHREWRAFCAGRASQLALPAGPVPEDALPEIVQAARDIVKLWDSEHVSEDDYNEEMVRIEKLFRALIGSPAVAQPVADERDAARYRKLRRWMGSNVPEGWKQVEHLGAVCAWMGRDEMDAMLDDMPECGVGLAASASPAAPVKIYAKYLIERQDAVGVIWDVLMGYSTLENVRKALPYWRKDSERPLRIVFEKRAIIDDARVVLLAEEGTKL